LHSIIKIHFGIYQSYVRMSSMGDSKDKWRLIFKGKIEDFDNTSHLYWKRRTATEKFAETKSLIDQAMKLKGINYLDASRLLRTTAVLKRQ
jgi:hypothetical protein